jgi:hypothetical protein
MLDGIIQKASPEPQSQKSSSLHESFLALQIQVFKINF